MRELLTFVAQSLVDHPDQVVVRETEGPEAVILELSVAEEDMGKVIGKQGAGLDNIAMDHAGLRCDCQEQQACFCRNSQAGRRRSSELNVGVGAVMFPRLF